VDPKQLRTSRTVSGACWSGTAAATSAIAPGAAANHGGLAADGDGVGELGSAQRSHQAVAVGPSAREEGRSGGRASWLASAAAEGGGARPLGGLEHRAGAACRASEADRSGARDGAGRPTVVLPLGSQHRQYCRNPLEVIRPRPPRGLAWQNSAPGDRGVEDERCPTAARRRATTERANAQAATRRGTVTGHPGRWEPR
jgi:hypothetical protein